MQGIRSQDRFILVIESAGSSQWWLFMNHQQNVTAVEPTSGTVGLDRWRGSPESSSLTAPDFCVIRQSRQDAIQIQANMSFPRGEPTYERLWPYRPKRGGIPSFGSTEWGTDEEESRCSRKGRRLIRRTSPT